MHLIVMLCGFLTVKGGQHTFCGILWSYMQVVYASEFQFVEKKVFQKESPWRSKKPVFGTIVM